MSYYINAYRKGNRISIPVEEKHLYKNSFTATIIKTNTTTPPQQTYLDTEDVTRIAQIDDISFYQGVENSQLVGNKIFLKDVAVTLNVRMSGDLMGLINGGSAGFDFFANCRVMVIQFDDDTDIPATDVVDWFRTSYIYYGTHTIGGETVPIQSVHQNRMRESTPWTGRFRILKDIPFKLTSKKSNLAMSFTINFEKDLTLMPKQSSSLEYKPTNDDFKHTYIYFFGPGNYSLDFDAYSARRLAEYTGGAQATMFELAYNIKYTFYDIN